MSSHTSEMHSWKRRRISSVAAAAAVLLASGCGSGSSRPGHTEWAGTIDTLASGRVVVRNPDKALPGVLEGGLLPELLRIGAADGDGADVFGEIRGLEIGPDGDLYVLDSQAAEIRVFDTDGRHLRSFSRSGRGPGELNRPAGMAIDRNGLIWILNWGNGRYSAYDAHSGQLVIERQRMASYVAIPWPGEFDASNRLLDLGLRTDGTPAALRLDTAFIPRDTIHLPRADERDQIVFTRGDVRVMSALEPFAPQPVWAPYPDGGIVIGEGDNYRIHRVSVRGDTTITIEVLRAAVPVTRAERDSALAAFQELAEMAGGATPIRQPRAREHKPAHGALFVDDQGRVWVRQNSRDSTTTWDIIDQDGRLVGYVSVPLHPSHVAPAVRAGRLAVVAMINEVPTIVVFDLRNSAGAT